MKCLSIQQPWADLIALGHKDVENRTWSSRYRGPVLLHAGKRFDRGHGLSDSWAVTADRLLVVNRAETRLGVIVGIAEMVGCGGWGQCNCSPWFVGPYGFVMRNPRWFKWPIPWRGQLYFFDVPDDIVADALDEAEREHAARGDLHS